MMHGQKNINLFLVYFVNLYMFRAYLGHHQEVQPYVYNKWYLLFFLDDCRPGWIPIQPGRIHTIVPPDDGPRFARNM